MNISSKKGLVGILSITAIVIIATAGISGSMYIFAVMDPDTTCTGTFMDKIPGN
jgi:hypothetical protein